MHPGKELTSDGRVGAAAQGEVLKTLLVHSRAIAPVVGQHRTARRGRIDVPARAAAAASRAGNVKSRPAQPPPEGTGVPPPSLGTWIWKTLFSGARPARLGRSHARAPRSTAIRRHGRQAIPQRKSV